MACPVSDSPCTSAAAIGRRTKARRLAGITRRWLTCFPRSMLARLFLELSTERAGEIDILAGLPDDKRIGVGVVNPKSPIVEAPDLLDARIRRAINTFGADRVSCLHRTVAFATFADNPVSSAAIAEAKLRAIVEARDRIAATISIL